MKPKPHRRLPKPKRKGIIHPDGLSRELMQHRVTTLVADSDLVDVVTAGELERDILEFLALKYRDRTLTIEHAQLGLSNVAQRLIVAYLKSVASP